MNRIITLAAGVAAALIITAAPASAGPGSRFAHLADNAMTACLYAPRGGGVVQAVPCRWASKGQVWHVTPVSPDQPVIMSLSRLCLTAVSRTVVATARCTARGQGQKWYRPPFFTIGAIAAQRFPGLCLATPRGGNPGPVRLAACGSAGQFWIFRSR